MARSQSLHGASLSHPRTRCRSGRWIRFSRRRAQLWRARNRTTCFKGGGQRNNTQPFLFAEGDGSGAGARADPARQNRGAPRPLLAARPCPGTQNENPGSNLLRPLQIGTGLSRDVLNPAHVALPGAAASPRFQSRTSASRPHSSSSGLFSQGPPRTRRLRAAIAANPIAAKTMQAGSGTTSPSTTNRIGVTPPPTPCQYPVTPSFEFHPK